jgi:hypothetical protein
LGFNNHALGNQTLDSGKVMMLNIANMRQGLIMYPFWNVKNAWSFFEDTIDREVVTSYNK